MNTQFAVSPLTPKEARIVEVFLASDETELEARQIIERANDICVSTVFSTVCRMAREGKLIIVLEKPRKVYKLGLYIVMVQIYSQKPEVTVAPDAIECGPCPLE
jgi:hypothetical protein